MIASAMATHIVFAVIATQDQEAVAEGPNRLPDGVAVNARK